MDLKRCLFFFCILFHGITGYSQVSDDKTSTFPSSAAANVINNHQVATDFYSGLMNVNIPVYTYSGKDLQIPVSILYRGGGVKPDELPSVLGIGWSLNAGGMITRVTKNQPDEYVPIVMVTYNFGGGIYFTDATASPSNSTYGQYSYYENCTKLNRSDWASTSFLNTLNTNSPYMTTLGSTSYRNANPLVDFEPDEFIFSFGGVSGRFALDYTGKWIATCDQPGLSFEVVPNLGQINKPSAHYIPRAFRQFKLIASDGTTYIFGNDGNTDSKNMDFSHKSFWQRSYDYVGPVSGEMPSAWHLSKIITASGLEVSFKYRKIGQQSQKIRNDWGYYPQQSIPAPKPIDKYMTETWFLDSISTSDGVRVEFLTSASTQLGSNEAVESDGVYLTDINSTFSLTNNGLNLFPKLNNVNVYYNGSLVKKYSFSYIENINERLKLEYFREEGLDNSNPMVYKFNYNESVKLPAYGSGKVDHWNFFNNVYYFASTTGPYSYTQLLNDFTASRNPSFTHSKAEILEKITLPAGGAIEFTYEPHLYSKTAKVWPFTVDDALLDKQAGGVRIQKVTTKDNGAVVDEKEYIYTREGSGLSSGVLASPMPVYISGNSSSYTFRAEGFQPFNSRGNHVVYTRVVEKFRDNSSKVYEYESFDNNNQQANDLTAINEIPSTHHWYNDQSYNNVRFKRGKLLKESTYMTGNANPIKTIEYQYAHNRSTPAKLRSIHFLPGKRWSDHNFYAASAFETDFFNDLVVNTKVKEITPSGTIETVTENTYDQYNNLVQTQSTNSNNEVIITTNKYSVNSAYSNPGSDYYALAIQNLRNKKVYNALIETYASRGTNTNPVSNQVVTAGAVHTYYNDKPLKRETYALAIAAPIPVGSYSGTSISNNAFQKDARYLRKVSVNGYDALGNELDVQKNANITESSLWGYGNRYQIAKVSNAGSQDVSYTSFDDRSTSWGYIPSYIVGFRSFTGEKSYDLAGTIWRTNMNPALSYKVSIWVKGPKPGFNGNLSGGGSQSLDNAFVWKEVKDGWDRYEAVITNFTGIGIWKYGHLPTSFVDELRLCPTTAFMSTYTYDPLMGMSSECDNNHRMAFYDYDAFGRPKMVRDIDGNVLKTFCYNLFGQTENCTNVFGNTYQSQNFTKQCGVNEVGSDVLYEVQANTYKSTKSVTDANRKALEEIVYLGQANANVNGTCQSISVYAQITIENMWYGGYTMYGDVVVRFYSDQSGTQPIGVNGITFNWQEELRTNGCYNTYYDYYNNSTQVWGDYAVLAYGVEVNYWDDLCTERVHSFYVMSGVGYLPL